MPTAVVANPGVRRSIAGTYVPTIYQEYDSVFDLISPIRLESVEKVIENFAEIVSLPTLNFGVREDSEFWYIYYMVYHPYDVSFSPIKIIRKLDSHRHDTEGILLRVQKSTGVTDIITVSHFLFKCARKAQRSVVIEANSHAIRPYNGTDLGPRGNYMVYKLFDLVDLNTLQETGDWERIRSDISKTASMPDEQYDNILSGSPSGHRINKRGDIWNRPDRLCKSLELTGRL